MKCTKFLTLGLTVSALVMSANMAHATDVNTNPTPTKSSHLKQDPNDVIVNTLFSNKTPAEQAQFKAQIAKYSQLQYGFGTSVANPSPQKDADIINNIKSHDPATVKSQMQKMREAAQEIPNLPQLKNK